MKYITAFFMAWGNFFYIPSPVKLWDNELRKMQLVFFPIIGVLIGLLWCALFFVLAKFGAPVTIAVFLLAIYPYKISGFIHLDGFMDCSDAILSRRDIKERQRILKDSHVGAFAVINVAILFIASYAAMSGIVAKYYFFEINFEMIAPLLFIPVVSRACSAFSVLAFEPINFSQYSDSFDATGNKRYWLLTVGITAICLVSAFVFFGSESAIILGILITVHFAVSFHARGQLGGMNGDIAGYALTISECTALFVWNFMI